MGTGDRRRAQREQEEGNSPFLIGFALFAFGFQTTAIFREEFTSALTQVYCTPEVCLTLPQVLTGWAIAMAPLPVYFWDRRAALYLGLFLVGLIGALFITTDLWVLPLSYFLVGLLFVPISFGIARLVEPGRRTLVVAAQHWLLLAGLLLWLA